VSGGIFEADLSMSTIDILVCHDEGQRDLVREDIAERVVSESTDPTTLGHTDENAENRSLSHYQFCSSPSSH
jgi:hypothetical protein